MKYTRSLILTTALAGLVALPLFGRGPGGGNRGGGGCGGAGACQYDACPYDCPRDPMLCTGTCPALNTPLQDGSGKVEKQRGNPNSTGTPLRDGSGKATAPGKGAKDGTGNQANCPNPAPKS